MKRTQLALKGTVFAWHLEIYVPTTSREVEVLAEKKIKGQNPLKIRKDAFPVSSTPNTPNPVDVVVSDRPPRLILAMNETHVTPLDQDPKLFKKGSIGLAEVKSILHWVGDRLKAGLDEAWSHADKRHGGMPLSMLEPKHFGEKPGNSPRFARYLAEEKWARLVTEMLMLTSYSQPFNVYLLPGGDLTYWKKLQEDAEPMAPLALACQHLATPAAITRGVRLHDNDATKGGFPAGRSTIDAMRAAKGFWLPANQKTDVVPDGIPPRKSKIVKKPDPKDPKKTIEEEVVFDPPIQQIRTHMHEAAPFWKIVGNVLAADPAKVPAPDDTDAAGNKTGMQNFGSGSVYLASNRENLTGSGGTSIVDQDNADGAHIAFVLRVDQEGRRVQTFDTAAIGDRDIDDVGAIEGAGNYDDPWAAFVPAPSCTFRGIGVLPPISAANLEKENQRTARVRPFGFGRLVVTFRAADAASVAKPAAVLAQKPQDWLVFASPLLCMHLGDDPLQNFHLSRLMWSLRQLPGCADLEASWLIDAPRNQFAKTVMAGSRAQRVSELVKQTQAGLPDPTNPQPNSKHDLAAFWNDFNLVLPLQEHAVNADGSMRLRFRFTTGGGKGQASHLQAAILAIQKKNAGKPVLDPADDKPVCTVGDLSPLLNDANFAYLLGRA